MIRDEDGSLTGYIYCSCFSVNDNSAGEWVTKLKWGEDHLIARPRIIRQFLPSLDR